MSPVANIQASEASFATSTSSRQQSVRGKENIKAKLAEMKKKKMKKES